MSLLRSDLPKVNSKNTLTSYFPIRTKDRSDIFDWDTILGHVVKYIYRKSLPSANIDEFKEQCKKQFLSKLDEDNFWPVLESMYFNGEELYKISPELLLFKAHKQKGVSSDARLGELFLNLLQDFSLTKKPQTKLNFIEREITSAFESFVIQSRNTETVVSESKETPYLPFLSKHFQNDLAFLNTKPKYLLSTFKDFIQLYSFLYTAQLTISLSEWQGGEPKSKACYFIMDNEKASEERTWVKNFGYNQLHNAFDKIFPYLSISESLQDPNKKKIPLWFLAQELENSSTNLNLLNQYARAFKEDRNLSSNISDADTTLGAIQNLLTLAVDQFGRSESRHEINVQYAKTTEVELCGHFIQSRGRAGRVLVFNQDYIVLLTNLAIGQRQEKLRFHQLMNAFKDRGIYFDKQSQQVLISFYERIGNVDRMSDSGDAVYVRKTI